MSSPRKSPKPTSPLASTALAVTITDLVAEYVVRHRFQNEGKESDKTADVLGDDELRLKIEVMRVLDRGLDLEPA